MSRELWLLRHGKSDWETEAPDFERPLKKRGRRDAHKMGVWMKQQALIPDWVMASPAERALATARRVCEELGVDVSNIHQDRRLYESNVALMQKVLSECPETAKRVLMVGHNPGLEQLLIDLVGLANLPFKKKLMPTAALARMELPDDWSRFEPECARLIAVTYAKSLFDTD